MLETNILVNIDFHSSDIFFFLSQNTFFYAPK